MRLAHRRLTDATAGGGMSSGNTAPMEVTRPRILVIDDDETCCRVRCLNTAFDLVITDERMPLVHGSEIAEELRADRPAIPILLISAFADARLAADASQLGVTLLAKPFATEQLLVAVREVLNRRADGNRATVQVAAPPPAGGRKPAGSR
jgi:DNA-binding NtrC family response regulator